MFKDLDMGNPDHKIFKELTENISLIFEELEEIYRNLGN